MWLLVATLTLSTGITVAPVDGKTFTSLVACESYKKRMGYDSSSRLRFDCKRTKP